MTTTAIGRRLTEHSEQDPLEIEKRPFVRLPHVVARDTRLGPNGLVYLAYRATFVGEYALHDAVLLRRPIVRGAGFGRDAIKRARRQACDTGYLQRRQGSPGADGRFGYAMERLTLPPCGASGKAGQFVRRDWFDGTLSLKEMAAYLYLRAGTEKGRVTYANELAKRFGWSLRTARKINAALIEFRLVAKSQRRASDGRLRGVAYESVSSVLWSISRDGKKPGHGAPGHGSSGHTLNSPRYALPSEEPSLPTSKLGSYTSCQREGQTTEENAKTFAFNSPRLLRWVEDEGLHNVLFDHGLDEDALTAITRVADDHGLRQRMRVAAERRVHRELLSAAGLFAVRYLAAGVLSNDETLTSDAALGLVIAGIRDRIGNRTGEWLNSLALVGKRILHPIAAGDGVDERLYGKGGKSRRNDPHTAQRLGILRQADGARILHPDLDTKPEGLELLLREYGQDALDTIKSVLTRAMIHDSAVGQVRSWGYFRGPLEDERCKTELAEAGMRPGDCAGWRYAHRNGGRQDA